MEASRRSLLDCGLGSHSSVSSYTVRLKASPVIVPSRSRKRPVLSMNVKSGVRRAGMLDALRAPILFLSTIRARSCAGHERRKCRMVSSSPRLHEPHPGLSATLMAHKCRFSGACPVRRRMRREVWHVEVRGRMPTCAERGRRAPRISQHLEQDLPDEEKLPKRRNLRW
jgi:hypothetical protein